VITHPLGKAFRAITRPQVLTLDYHCPA